MTVVTGVCPADTAADASAGPPGGVLVPAVSAAVELGAAYRARHDGRAGGAARSQ